MRKTIEVLCSERDHPLMYQRVLDVPVITVENYEKWYSIYLIQPTGEIEEVPVKVIEEVMGDNCWWIDHRWHPKLLLALAKHYGGEVPDTTIEVVAGRWVLEQELLSGIDYGREDLDEEPPVEEPAPQLYRSNAELWKGYDAQKINMRVLQARTVAQMSEARFKVEVENAMHWETVEREQLAGGPPNAYWYAVAKVTGVSKHWLITGDITYEKDRVASESPISF